MAFGLYNVHSVSGVTEGGLLGAELLLEHWFLISPSLTGAVLSTACYFFGWKRLGIGFVVRSAVGAAAFSVSYAIFECFEPIWENIAEHPLWAALLGAVFVGVGTGLCVREGAAICGDDALAMTVSEMLKIKVETVYLINDLVVLALSLTYIPVRRIAYSVLTVILSGRFIGIIQRFDLRKIRKNG